MDAWLDVINAKPDYWDQNAFNDMARAGWDPAKKVRAQGRGGEEGSGGQGRACMGCWGVPGGAAGRAAAWGSGWGMVRVATEATEVTSYPQPARA